MSNHCPRSSAGSDFERFVCPRSCAIYIRPGVIEPPNDTMVITSRPDSEPFAVVDSQQDSVYSVFEHHLSDKAVDHDTPLLSSIRGQNPGCTITTVPAQSCDLIYYASLGHAHCELDTDDSLVNRWRLYRPPTRRSGRGKLIEDVKFGKYSYTWQNEDFRVYLIQIGSDFWFNYIVKAPGEGETALTHCKITDALVQTVSEYQLGLHQEILVFDAYWRKNHALWQEVQKASWDSVILDPRMKKDLVDTAETFFSSRESYKELEVPWKVNIPFTSDSCKLIGIAEGCDPAWSSG